VPRVAGRAGGLKVEALRTADAPPSEVVPRAPLLWEACWTLDWCGRDARDALSSWALGFQGCGVCLLTPSLVSTAPNAGLFQHGRRPGRSGEG
jgi:hypothetical protein